MRFVFKTESGERRVAFGEPGDDSLYPIENPSKNGPPATRPRAWIGNKPICKSWVCVEWPGMSGGGQDQATTDQAFKADAGKPRFELLMDGCANALLDVAKVLTWAVHQPPCAPWPHGGKGYVPHSWKEVPEAKRRYRAAMQRHENAIARGETHDSESGLPHRAHVATNALFLAELDYLYPESK